MHVLGCGDAQADVALHGRRLVDELASAGNDRDGADLLLEGIDGAHDLEGQLRNAVAEAGERQAFEDDVGDATIGGCRGRALLGGYEAVGGLVLGARVDAIGDVGEVEFLAVGPDAADARDLALADGDGEVGVVVVLRAGRRRGRTAAFAGTAGFGVDGLFLEVGGPDDLAAKPSAAIDAGHVAAFARDGDTQIGEARAVGLARVAASAEQGLVDEAAGQRADLRADGGAGQRRTKKRDAGRQQRAADGRTDGGQCQSGHGETFSGLGG